jgi:hypothetical protein
LLRWLKDHGRSPLVATSVASIALLYIAHRTEVEFWRHLFTELGVAGIGIVLTVVFVEELLERRRRQQRRQEWRLFAEFTLQSLSELLHYSTLLTMVQFANREDDIFQAHLRDRFLPDETGWEALRPTKQKSFVARLFARRIEANSWPELSEVKTKEVLRWVDTIKPMIDSLRHVLIPRLLLISENTLFLRAVARYDDVLFSLELRTELNKQGILAAFAKDTQDVRQLLVALMKATARLYRLLETECSFDEFGHWFARQKQFQMRGARNSRL